MEAYRRRLSFRVEKPPVSGRVLIKRHGRSPARPSGDAALPELIGLYLRSLPHTHSKRGRPYSEKTISGYRYYLEPFGRWCGDQPVRALTASLVADYRASLRARNLADWTVRGTENAINVFALWCVQRGVLAVSPLEELHRTRGRDTAMEIVTPEGIAAMLGVCDMRRWYGVRNRAVVLTLVRTGLRAKELCDLDLADYDTERERLRVRHGKGDKYRIVGIPADAAASIEDWLILARGRDPGPLFPSERGGRLNRDTLSHLIPKLALRVGRDYSAHQLRHTFAVNYLQAGGDLYHLSRLLGHSTVATTEKYLRAVKAEEAADEHRRVLRRGRRQR